MRAKSGKQKFIKNFSNLALSTLISTLCSFLCFTILGNKMSVSDYGQFSIIIALASSVAVFVNNIFASIVANREIAINPLLSRKLLLSFFKIRTLVFILVLVPLGIYAQNRGYETFLSIGLISLVFVDAFYDLFEQIAFGLKITKYSMLLNGTSSIIWLLIVWLMPIEFFRGDIVVLIYSLVGILKTIAYGAVVFKVTNEYAREESSLSFRYLLFNSLPYLYNRLFGIVSTQLPILLLDGYSGLDGVAYYSVGEKFTVPITKLTMVVVSAVFPIITSAFKTSKQKTGKLIIDSFQIALSVGACLCLFVSMTSEWMLTTVLGEKYSQAAEAFNYQIWFTIVLAVDSLFSMILSADFKQKTLSVVTTIDTLSLIPFLYFGIRFGAKGVALAKLIHSIICLFYHIVIAKKYWGNGNSGNRLILSWIVYIAMACLCICNPSKVVLLGALLVTSTFAVLLNYNVLKRFLTGKKYLRKEK